MVYREEAQRKQQKDQGDNALTFEQARKHKKTGRQITKRGTCCSIQVCVLEHSLCGILCPAGRTKGLKGLMHGQRDQSVTTFQGEDRASQAVRCNGQPGAIFGATEQEVVAIKLPYLAGQARLRSGKESTSLNCYSSINQVLSVNHW